jgi:hypothetical protein
MMLNGDDAMADWDRIAKLAGRLGSGSPAEAASAIRMIDAQLRPWVLSWADFAARLRGTSHAARTSAERTQDRRRAWDARMAEEEKRTRQQARRRPGRDW